KTTRDRIEKALKLGMPLNSVADYVELDVSIIHSEMHRDRGFRKAVKKAIAECMHERLEALKELRNWQALAFILESIWPNRFGRKSSGHPHQFKLAGNGNGPIISRLTKDEQEDLEYLLAKAYGRPLPEGGRPGAAGRGGAGERRGADDREGREGRQGLSGTTTVQVRRARLEGPRAAN